MDRKTVIAVVVTAVIFGAAGFGGGALLGRATAATRVFGGNAAWQAMRDGRAGGQNAARGGMTVGRVTEKGKDSFTVKTPDGSTRTVYVSGSTQYSKTTSATIADVSVDTTVAAFGTATSAGDVTAQRVQIGGDFGVGGFRGMFGGNRTGQGGQGNGGPRGDVMVPGPGAGGPPPGF